LSHFCSIWADRRSL